MVCSGRGRSDAGTRFDTMQSVVDQSDCDRYPIVNSANLHWPEITECDSDSLNDIRMIRERHHQRLPTSIVVRMWHCRIHTAALRDRCSLVQVHRIRPRALRCRRGLRKDFGVPPVVCHSLSAIDPQLQAGGTSATYRNRQTRSNPNTHYRSPAPG